MQKVKNRMWLFTITIIVGLFLFFLYRYFGHRWWGIDYPINSFLFLAQDRFMDFFHINRMAATRDPYAYGSSYPPLALVVAFLFGKIIPGSATMDPFEVRDTVIIGKIMLFSMYLVCLLIIVYAVGSRLGVLTKDEGISISTNSKGFQGIVNRFLSHDLLLFASVAVAMFCIAPTIYAFDRGNYIIITVMLLVIFSLYYDRNDYVAAICLALAAAMKVFPVVIFLVFFIGKKWKPLFTGLFVGGFLTVASARFLYGGTINNLIRFLKATFLYSGGFNPNSTYYYRYAVGIRNVFGTFWLLIAPKHKMKIDFGFSTIVAGIIIFLLVIILCYLDKRIWRQILYLSLFMVLFPSPSFYYNLTYLIGPIVAFIFKDKWSKWDTAILIALTFLMIPKNYYYVLGKFFDGIAWVSINTLIDPLVMCLILGLAVIEVIYTKRLDYKIKHNKRLVISN